MELSRGEVPLYGQVEVSVKLPESESVLEETDFYVLLVGSSLHHVTTARRTEDHNSLRFTAPGHIVPEKVSVEVYCCARGTESPISPLCHSEPLSLQYTQDEAQEVAEQLLTFDSWTSSTHWDILHKLCPERRISIESTHSELTRQHKTDGGELFSLENSKGLGVHEQGTSERDPEVWCTVERPCVCDEKVTQALANLHFLQCFNQTDDKKPVPHPWEMPVHVPVLMDFPHLSQFFLLKSDYQKRVPVVDEEGEGLMLADEQKGPEFKTLTDSPRRPVWMCQIWKEESLQLRICPVTDSLSMTIKHETQIDAQTSIQLFREKSKKPIKQMQKPSESFKESTLRSDEWDADENLSTKIEDQTLVDSVFEEQLVLCLDEEEEDYLNTFSPEKLCSSPGSSTRFPLHSTDAAAIRLSGMLQGSTQYTIPGVTEDSSGTDSGVWQMSDAGGLSPGTVDAAQATKEEEGQSGDHLVSRSLSPTSPAGLILDRLLRATRSVELNCNSSSESSELRSPILSLSPSLVALEVDSEEDDDDDILMKKPLPQKQAEPKNSTDEHDLPSPAPDLTCTRSHSASSACYPAPSKDGEQGIRFRSYSYTSPKISLLPPRFSKDAHPPSTDLIQDGALSSSSGSRSLLQALSLSKSLSLLNPVKHRSSSISEQAQEKRELRFRRRAQSADDESSSELADSLQHLTLSEFLKEIEEEEWDKYIIPSKTESEKYKVSRTFSFIKSRMYSTRNKNKGKGKETKDKQVNGHQFTAGSVLGSTLCEICGKPASGKEVLHCTYCAVSVHKGCKDSSVPCLKKPQDKYSVLTVKSRTASLPQNFVVRESSSSSSQITTSTSLPVMTPRDSALLPCQLSRNSPQQNELLLNPGDLEAESWSLAVEPQFCKMQEKHIIKRQDVIYEFMQTELHHVQTLMMMAEVFRRGMREEVGLDADAIGRIFPCLDELLLLHRDFLSSMRERRQSCIQPNSNKNYLIHRVGDIFLQQFSKENAEKMKLVYGEFCSHHSEAVSYFKELQQQNKRFQLFIKQQSSNSLLKRREIPECILLVTQRITKYPVLLERILQYTMEGTEEHADLSRALALIRELISAVDQCVSQYEQNQKLNVLALLLSDSLVFLQEKDQKYIFAAVKLIVREVANEERGMFLISASSAGPEMYEVHAASKDERNAWMRLIREAVESCPEEDDETTSESEEERRVTEAKVQKIHRLQETLCGHDHLICASLEEKLHIYAELSVMAGHREAGLEPRLLVRPSIDDVPQAGILLTAALREEEVTKAEPCSPSSPLPFEKQSTLVEPVQGEKEEWRGEEGFNHNSDVDQNIHLKVSQSVQSLAQLLYSLQAAVTIQDSCYEVQKLLLLLLSNPSPHTNSRQLSITRSSQALQDQERQREAERHREEVADVARLKGVLLRERQQWERECQARQLQQSELESTLEQRELLCHLEERRLQSERLELQEQLQEYQQSLERLREGQRSVQREKDKVDAQRRLLENLRLGFPQRVPSMVIPLDGQHTQDPLGGQDEHGSIFVNEAALLSSSVNNRHIHLQHHPQRLQQTVHQHSGSIGFSDTPSAQNSLNSFLARSNHRENPLSTLTENPCNNVGQNSHLQDSWSAGVTGEGLHHVDVLFANQPFVTMETENRDTDGEETIVYL
ncbi:hypothetical protein DNTS_012251 [Danionella cerebrum]|uniref:DH domain-containing protein n=1 Tax=Danionella cerebrum TaxID=2873325 RepID=A0A553N2A6_9TELE|nr:hypothetical protein DNTS_012251 [Danionella translucida]